MRKILLLGLALPLFISGCSSSMNSQVAQQPDLAETEAKTALATDYAGEWYSSKWDTSVTIKPLKNNQVQIKLKNASSSLATKALIDEQTKQIQLTTGEYAGKFLQTKNLDELYFSLQTNEQEIAGAVEAVKFVRQ